MKAVFKNTAATVLIAACLLSGVAFLPAARTPARAQKDSAATLLETGGASKASKSKDAPAELKVVSYNIRYRGGDDLQKLIKLLRDDGEIGGAAVIGLQEVDRNKKRTRNVNTARVIADALGMNYAWAAPPDADGDGEEETGVALFSIYPLSDVERVVLTHEGPEGRRRVALGATVQVGATPVRVYSVHAETRMPIKKKVEHWRAVLDDLRRHAKVERAVALGDFNTIKEKDVRAARRLFAGEGFTTPFPDDWTTWKTFIVKLKLDWLWLRGMEAVEFGIDKDVGLSDHWPLWAKIKLGKNTEARVATDTATTKH
ncbi:MAG TPA: endonuclease/exonuclease/phosphatase family protein [Pyrinomonadaceae bacterium]|nr:endonuclease/exonuclease/phosphatase family protein [Pyrinomonadaceae bacterium]